MYVSCFSHELEYGKQIKCITLIFLLLDRLRISIACPPTASTRTQPIDRRVPRHTLYSLELLTAQFASSSPSFCRQCRI